MRIYATLYSRRGYSQVLFVGILSPHIDGHFEVAMWGERDVLDGCQTCFRGAKIVTYHLHLRSSDGTMNTRDIIVIFLVYKRRSLSTRLQILRGIGQQFVS